jgi:hypothetical protein
MYIRRRGPAQYVAEESAEIEAPDVNTPDDGASADI